MNGGIVIEALDAVNKVGDDYEQVEPPEIRNIPDTKAALHTAHFNPSPVKRPDTFSGIPAQSFSDPQRFGHAMRQGISARRPRVQG